MANDGPKKLQIDDKDLAIIGLVAIAIACIIAWKTSNAVQVVVNIVTAIAGIVTGRSMARNASELPSDES